MFDLFGEMDSYEELNETAAGLLAEGDVKNIGRRKRTGSGTDGNVHKGRAAGTDGCRYGGTRKDRGGSGRFTATGDSAGLDRLHPGLCRERRRDGKGSAEERKKCESLHCHTADLGIAPQISGG